MGVLICRNSGEMVSEWKGQHKQTCTGTPICHSAYTGAIQLTDLLHEEKVDLVFL